MMANPSRLVASKQSAVAPSSWSHLIVVAGMGDARDSGIIEQICYNLLVGESSSFDEMSYYYAKIPTNIWRVSRNESAMCWY